MEALAVDLGGELGQRVERGVLRTPVEAVAPMVDQALQVGDADAGVPRARVGEVFPLESRYPLADRVKPGLRYVDAERDGRHRSAARLPNSAAVIPNSAWTTGCWTARSGSSRQGGGVTPSSGPVIP